MYARFHTVKIKVAMGFYPHQRIWALVAIQSEPQIGHIFQKIIFPNFPKRMVSSIHIPKAINIPWLLWPISWLVHFWTFLEQLYMTTLNHLLIEDCSQTITNHFLLTWKTLKVVLLKRKSVKAIHYTTPLFYLFNFYNKGVIVEVVTLLPRKKE